MEYIGILKTTDAELKGFEKLADDVKDQVIPLFELTKARRTKKDTYGDIHKKMIRLEEVVGTRPFILDVTSHADLSNYQLEDLLSSYSGFLNWRNFLNQYNHLNIIPAIHIDPDNLTETTNLVRNLSSYPRLALRIEVWDADTTDYLRAILAELGAQDRLIILIDCGYLSADEFNSQKLQSVERISEILSLCAPGMLSVAVSGFPKSVFQHTGNCLDHEGHFDKLEPLFYDQLNALFPGRLTYSDYCSVHPIRYEVTGGSWVPRVDFPMKAEYAYTRYRRIEGGYILAAQEMIASRWFAHFDCWGCREIFTASSGAPNGLSPSHWISVRINIHISRRILNI